jgi:hypothetical protein
VCVYQHVTRAIENELNEGISGFKKKLILRFNLTIKQVCHIQVVLINYESLQILKNLFRHTVHLLCNSMAVILVKLQTVSIQLNFIMTNVIYKFLI